MRLVAYIRLDTFFEEIVWQLISNFLKILMFPGKGHGLPTPVFLPGESHGQRNLVSYNPGVTKGWT